MVPRAPFTENATQRFDRIALSMIAVFACSRAITAVMFTGFGLDESYTIAISRSLALSYYDHPPLHQWITHVSVSIFGIGPWVRLPFVGIAAGTGWIVFRMTSEMFGRNAGLWALFAFSISPYFFAVAGSWISPDGILLFCLAGATYSVQQVLFSPTHMHHESYRRWIVVGLWTGFAGLSKYSALFFPFGLFLFLAFSRQHRHWLTHPAAYVGAAVGALMTAPVLIWNGQHDWVSFAFQAGRAIPATAGNLSMLATMAGGQILFLSPFIFPALVAATVWAIRKSSAHDVKRLLLFLGLPTIVFMTLTPVWGNSGLPHWPIPGWFFIFPLLGGWIDHLQVRMLWKRIWAGVTGGLTLVLAVIFVSLQSSNWLLSDSQGVNVTDGAIVETLNWHPIREAKAFRSTPDWTPSFVIAQNWIEGGKVDLAVGDRLPVLVLSSDPRGFAFRQNSADFVGANAVIIAHDFAAEDLLNRLRPYFEKFDAPERVQFGRDHRPEVNLFVMKAYKMLRPYPLPYGIAAVPSPSSPEPP